MQNFRIRASAIGEIMTNDRSGKFPGKTATSYVDQWIKEQIYGRSKGFESKYTDKGVQMEDEAIDFASDQLGWGFVMKNEQWKENDHITGTPDIILRDSVADIKCSWDCFSFPLFDDEIPNKNYWWQLQGYMDLLGFNRATLVYCLMDSPDNLIESEAKRKSYAAGYDEIDGEIYEEVKSEMTYSHLDQSVRIKTFQIDRDDEAIESIHNRVEYFREYIKTRVK